METDEWKDDFIESYVKIGVDQGREEGREEGAAETKAQDVLKAMDVRGLRPSKEQRAKVIAAAGLAKLEEWFERALTATTATDVFEDGEQK
jgi:hypothetical protein